jgi:hypothetical protein
VREEEGRRNGPPGGVGPEEREQAARGEMGCGFWAKREGWFGVLFVCLFIYLFFSKPFSNLFKLTFQTFEIELFSKHSKIFKIFLKSFKTSHKQIIKPCIQNMMHKHLLLQNY